MATITRNPTSNSSPDAGQGGNAVTTPSNTGHAATTASASNGASDLKTCKWTTFQTLPVAPVSLTLKVDWSENGSTSGAPNQFQCDYSVNGGSSWTTLFQHGSITSANSGTASASLSASQNISQVQVRDSLSVVTSSGTSASVTGTISNVRLEADVNIAQSVLMMA